MTVIEQPISSRFDSYFARSRFLLSLPLPPPLFFCPRTAKMRSGDEIKGSDELLELEADPHQNFNMGHIWPKHGINVEINMGKIWK